MPYSLVLYGHAILKTKWNQPGEDFAYMNFAQPGRWNDTGLNSPEWGGISLGLAEYSIPEPSTVLLLGFGLIGLGVFGRKKFGKS